MKVVGQSDFWVGMDARINGVFRESVGTWLLITVCESRLYLIFDIKTTRTSVSMYGMRQSLRHNILPAVVGLPDTCTAMVITQSLITSVCQYAPSDD